MRRRQIKVVLDTNVLISSLWGGNPGKIIELWDQGRIHVAVSLAIVDEYFAVLNRFDLTEDDMDDIALLFSDPKRTLVIEPEERMQIIKRDLADNKFLECAIAGKSEYIISGDTHLLELKTFKGIGIVTPAEFLLLTS